MKILVINGPNINMLGVREKNIYGENSFESLKKTIASKAVDMNIDIDHYQSNVEGEIVTVIQDARGVYDGIVINPAAYTHYSIAILDALKAAAIPSVEVHISNIHKREEFRHKSVTAEACIGQIAGFGIYGYNMAIDAVCKYILDIE